MRVTGFWKPPQTTLREQLIDCDHAINSALRSIGPHIEKCPPGVAFGAMDLRNRGHDDYLVEITCWPDQNKHYCLTAGSREGMEHIKLRGEQERMMAVLGLNRGDVQDWIERWRRRAGVLAGTRPTHRTRPTHKMREKREK